MPTGTTSIVRVTACADDQTLSRLIDLFAMRGLAIDQLAATRRAGLLHAKFRLTDEAADQVHAIAAKMRRIVGVQDVALREQ